MSHPQNVQSNTTDSKELQTPDEKALARYKKQLEALRADSDYDNFEDKRKQLATYYEENITRLQARIDTKASRNIEYTGTVVHPYKTG